MVFKRKFYKRRGRKSSVATKKYVRKLIDRTIEDKTSHGTMLTNYGSISTEWIHQTFTNMPAGTAASNRVGRKINIKSILFYGVISGGAVDGSVDDYQNTIRCIIGIWNKPPSFSYTQIGMSNFIAKDGYSNGDLVRKLYDKYIVIPALGLGHTGYVPGMKVFKYYKRFKKPLTITFGVENGTTNQIPDKNICMSMISDSAVVPNPGFVTGWWNVRFEDA